MKIFFKRLVQAVGVLLLLFVAFGLYLSFGDFDIEPQDYSDMKIKRRNIPKEQNALYVYRKAWEAVIDKEKLIDLYNKEDVNKEVICEILKENKSTLDLIDKALRMDFEEEDLKSLHDDNSHFMLYLDLRCLFVLQLRAFDDLKYIESYLRFCEQIAERPENFISLAMAMGAHSGFYLEMLKRVKKSKDPQFLKYLNTKLTVEPNYDSFLFALKGEFEHIENELDSLIGGGVKEEDLEEVYFWDFARYWSVRASFFYQPEQTKSYVSRDFRDIKIAIEEGFDEYIAEDDLSNPPARRKGQNTTGRVIHKMYVRATIGFYHKVLAVCVKIRLLKLRIAMRLYELDHGENPEALANLVPSYLDKVYKDPFDGENLRYDPTKRLIYSIGENRKDDEGRTHDESKDWDDFDDIVIKLD